MAPDRRFALLVNPASAGGKALRTVGEAVEVMTSLGAEHRVVETTSADNAREEAATAVSRGETVVAVGGDGLVGLLAGVLKGGDSALAVVPAGRGNDFARVLKIPFEAAESARVAVQAPERSVDVGAVDGKPFVCIASLGFDSDCNRIANETKWLKGNLVYLYSALRVLAGWKPARFTARVDGEEHSWSGFSVAVANSKAYGGGMYVAPHAELDDGRLEVLMTGGTSKLAFLRGVARSFKGAHVDDPNIHWYVGARIEVEADRRFTVYADGDPIADLPVTVTVEPRALRVIAPESA
ncbi:MAG: diacylglycerol kinase family lipid kinase [Thermoleophilaceae bacterium]|nr:diacylglycerol kinase family lipid kinase [Thermoleophilaceae bacterium]